MATDALLDVPLTPEQEDGVIEAMAEADAGKVIPAEEIAERWRLRIQDALRTQAGKGNAAP